MTQPISGFTVAPADQDAVYRAQAQAPTDWSTYRKCSQVCSAPIGEPCVSLSGKIVGGYPDKIRTVLAVPHNARKRRTVRRAR